MQFSPHVKPIPLVFGGNFRPEILRGWDSLSGGVKQGRKTSHFLALNGNISKTAGVWPNSKLTVNGS